MIVLDDNRGKNAQDVMARELIEMTPSANGRMLWTALEIICTGELRAWRMYGVANSNLHFPEQVV